MPSEQMGRETWLSIMSHGNSFLLKDDVFWLFVLRGRAAETVEHQVGDGDAVVVAPLLSL